MVEVDVDGEDSEADRSLCRKCSHFWVSTVAGAVGGNFWQTVEDVEGDPTLATSSGRVGVPGWVGIASPFRATFPNRPPHLRHITTVSTTPAGLPLVLPLLFLFAYEYVVLLLAYHDDIYISMTLQSASRPSSASNFPLRKSYPTTNV